MIEAFCRGDDLHRLTAALLLGKAVADVTPEEHRAAKAVNFVDSFMACAQPVSRAHARDHYGVELDDPKRYIERFFMGYSVLAHQHPPSGPLSTVRNPYQERSTAAMVGHPGIDRTPQFPCAGHRCGPVEDGQGAAGSHHEPMFTAGQDRRNEQIIVSIPLDPTYP